MLNTGAEPRGRLGRTCSRTALAVFLLFIALPAFGQLTVTYTEGFPQVKGENRWRDVVMGDTVAADAYVRLDEGEYLEIDAPSGVLRFSAPGDYRLSEVAGRAKEAEARSSVISLIGGKLNRTVTGTDYQKPSVVGGVRGAEAGETDDLFFMESESLDLIRRGQELLHGVQDRERLETAARYFEEARVYAMDDSEENEALFYLSYVALRRGEPEKAMEYVSTAQPAAEAPYYGAYLLLAGRIYLLNGRPHKAVRLLNAPEAGPLAEGMLTAEEGRNILLLLGTAQAEAGQRVAARHSLQKLLDEAPESEEAAVAGRILSGL